MERVLCEESETCRHRTGKSHSFGQSAGGTHPVCDNEYENAVWWLKGDSETQKLLLHVKTISTDGEESKQKNGKDA